RTRLRAVEYEIAIAKGHLERAEQLAHARLTAAEQACPDGCLDTVLALHELAQVSWYLGRAEDALELSSRGHRLSIAELGARHEQSLELAQLRANVLAELGESDESIVVLEEILALRTLTAASDSATVVSTRFALAQALAGQPARAAEAEATYRRVVEDATQGRHEHFVGMATSALGSLYFRRGELAWALAADRRAIEILERVHGGGYPQLATLVNNHAVHLAAADDAAGALEAALRAWDMWHAVSPEPSPQDAAFLQNIARQLITLARPEEALPWLERALAVTDSEPTSGPGTASRMTMADALLALGRSAQADQLRVEARRRCAELSVERRAAAKCALIPPP
ncbi:MAG: tetratricopeptide repeat protein, partial [Deltaproteobacteria bacterium]|nr:tetratricopeptide repeat protein [Nannocystaceae bacterium]